MGKCKHCTKCHSFAWWDGDFCCTMRMAIMESSKDGKYWAILPEAFNANNCDDYDERENYGEEVHEYYNQYIEFLRTLTTEKLTDDELLQKYGYKQYK